MTFEQLKYFVTLVEGENFLEVAEKLYISQSSLSKQIKKLEEELEVSLLDRSGRKAKLTEGGEFFYLEAKKLLLEYEKLLENIKPYKKKNILSIGVLPILSQYNLNLLFQNFKSIYPDIELIIDEQEENLLKENILNKKYDFVISRDLFEKNLIKCETIAKDEIVAVYSSSHILTQDKFINFSQLKKEKILTMNNYTTVYKKIMLLSQKIGVDLNIVRTGRIESLVDYIKIEDAVALIPFKSLNIFKKDGLDFLPIVPSIDLDVFLIKNKDTHYSESMKIFHNFVKNYLK
ncbi:LysR family transcriptional regulator [Fusobacterium mortiferum]|uniref:LysR family transcriptional regulator n=1 Tax=Fusobacterium mortiferum ATCC 9817 TaxID=469616 RepID=A0ABN5JC94_FUSMR|nr:LysR family transcriptional regulator [Fusobacterium mortiferum]AVQ19420.1 LysR family transcriptional regulator [Fusobacterium mortiferum ATCC 9817]EEO36176.1 transcriptional regulator, LysR family [Fusobacterium mortiferum ATCC 9817]RGN00736.1 LysR family transcriptional regulator [Fusobacterium mortiferum]RHF66661.1 LysR family transcriptional regulator [Fusobacterium mortiferum]